VAGGIIAAILVKFIDSSFTGSITTSPRWDRDGNHKSFSASISEIMGTFFFVQMFMICTDSKSQFSKDRVVNCFIISAGYISSRLLAGGELVSVSGT
jgi:glycerol uptake facilitator-like aquaporin